MPVKRQLVALRADGEAEAERESREGGEVVTEDMDRVSERLAARIGECGPDGQACTVDTWHDSASMPEEVRRQARFNPCPNHAYQLARGRWRAKGKKG